MEEEEPDPLHPPSPSISSESNLPFHSFSSSSSSEDDQPSSSSEAKLPSPSSTSSDHNQQLSDSNQHSFKSNPRSPSRSVEANLRSLSRSSDSNAQSLDLTPQSLEAEVQSLEAKPASASPSASCLTPGSSYFKKTLVKSLPRSFGTERYVQLVKLFYDYDHKTIDMPEFELGVVKLIKKLPLSLDAFKRLLPTANLIASPSKRGKTVFIRQTCTFNDRVRAGLYNDSDNYMMWLKHLIQFKNGSESFKEFRREVEPHFENMADLWKEFDANFASGGPGEKPIMAGDIERTNQDSISGEVSSDSSDPKPDFKRSETE